jgi:predicted nucleic acid-binding protein
VRIVIADAGPPHYLVLTGYIDVLPKLFTTVFIPDAVHAELSHQEAPQSVRHWIASHPEWLTVSATRAIDDASLNMLDGGERAAVALAMELRADLILMDDRVGVAAARARGLAVTGTLGILAMAARDGTVDLAEAFAKLKTTNFRYRQEILDFLLSRHPAAQTDRT